MGIWWFGIIVVVGAYLIGTKKVVIPDEYIVIYLLAFLITMVSMLVSMYRDYAQDDGFKSFLKDPTSDMLRSSDRVLASEIGLYAKLDEYSIEALSQTRNYLQRKKTLIESISSMLVGVLTKVGLLPAVLATVLVTLKIYSEVGLSPVTLVGFVSIGMYFFCFKLIEASVKFEEYQSIISDYIEIRKNKKGEKRTNQDTHLGDKQGQVLL